MTPPKKGGGKTSSFGAKYFSTIPKDAFPEHFTADEYAKEVEYDNTIHSREPKRLLSTLEVNVTDAALEVDESTQMKAVEIAIVEHGVQRFEPEGWLGVDLSSDQPLGAANLPSVEGADVIVNQIADLLRSAEHCTGADFHSPFDKAKMLIAEQGKLLFGAVQKAKVRIIAFTLRFHAVLESFPKKYRRHILEELTGDRARIGNSEFLLILQALYPAPLGATERHAFQKRVSALASAASWCDRKGYVPSQLEALAQQPGQGIDAWARLEADYRRNASSAATLLSACKLQRHELASTDLEAMSERFVDDGSLAIELGSIGHELEDPLELVTWATVGPGYTKPIIRAARFLPIRDADETVIGLLLDQLVKELRQ